MLTNQSIYHHWPVHMSQLTMKFVILMHVHVDPCRLQHHCLKMIQRRVAVSKSLAKLQLSKQASKRIIGQLVARFSNASVVTAIQKIPSTIHSHHLRANTIFVILVLTIATNPCRPGVDGTSSDNTRASSNLDCLLFIGGILAEEWETRASH
jgi:hypothetical protein